MLLSALKSYYVGHINKHIANVEIYLSRSTGIGESDKDQTTFTDFVSWIENYNTYIMNMWDEKVNSTMSTEDENTVDQFVQIDNQDVA